MRPKIKVAGHAVQGRGHAAQNMVCQDKVYVFRFRDKRSASVALADGAGSCSHSQIGAEYAVQNIGDIIHEDFDAYFMSPEAAGVKIVSRLQAGLKAFADTENIDFESLSSTLLFIYVRRNGKGAKYFACHIGDGVIAVMNRKTVQVLSHPENGEYASSTFFLTSSKASDHLRIHTGVLKGNAGFLLLSDGTAEGLYHKRYGTLAPACELMLRWFDKHPQEKIYKVIRKNLEKVFTSLTLDDCSVAALGITGMERIHKGKRKEN